MTLEWRHLFLDRTPKNTGKKGEIDFYQTKNLLSAKEATNRMKRQPKNECACKLHLQQRLVAKIYKELESK